MTDEASELNTTFSHIADTINDVAAIQAHKFHVLKTPREVSEDSIREAVPSRIKYEIDISWEIENGVMVLDHRRMHQVISCILVWLSANITNSRPRISLRMVGNINFQILIRDSLLEGGNTRVRWFLAKLNRDKADIFESVDDELTDERLVEGVEVAMAMAIAQRLGRKSIVETTGSEVSFLINVDC